MGKKGSLAMPGWQSTAGANNPRAKLTDDQVREIRTAGIAVRPEVLAIKYGVSASTIRNVQLRRFYRSVV